MSGNIWMYSYQIDDEDLEMLKRDFITYKMGIEYYRFGMKPFTRLVREAGAVFKIGKMVRINRHSSGNNSVSGLSGMGKCDCIDCDFGSSICGVVCRILYPGTVGRSKQWVTKNY